MTGKKFYAKAAIFGPCYSFPNKEVRDLAVRYRKLIPLTAAEAMKQFGYTDSCSRRVISCIHVSGKKLEVFLTGVQ